MQTRPAAASQAQLRQSITNSMIDKAKADLIRDLLQKFNVLEAAGAGKVGHPDNDRRNQLLDELQDAAGLAGKMVMERDILRKAELALKQVAS
jgi:hypothetical protein